MLAFLATPLGTCDSPAWHVAHTLDPANSCPGQWRQWVVPGLSGGDTTVCSRGRVLPSNSQASAIVVEGWQYTAVRGSVTGISMGSPDAFRPEAGRGSSSPTIDDAYVDGISITRWTHTGRVHMATYASGLAYNARRFSFYINGNCICHGGAELPPEWLGESNYFCDAGMRGGPNCQVGGFADEPGYDEGCSSSDACNARGCTSYWNGATWYGANSSAMWSGPAGYLCRGKEYATVEDFPGRPFGSFLHNVQVDTPQALEWASDPIEVRIMSGQAAAAAEGTEVVAGNEETALAALQIEVFGCRLPMYEVTPAPFCGDGNITSGNVTSEQYEQCDHGTASDSGDSSCGLEGNGFGRACSIACTDDTSFNPEACRISGTCPQREVEEPSGQDFPGAEPIETGNRWVTIANVSFDDLLRSAAGSVAAACETRPNSHTSQPACFYELLAAGGNATSSSVGSQCARRVEPAMTTCPGNTKKYKTPPSNRSADGRYVCAAPFASRRRAGGPYSFFINVPERANYIAVRGRIVTNALGQPDAFMTAGWLPHDYSMAECYRPGACGDTPGFAGNMYTNEDGRDTSLGIDGWYVDGLSLTVRMGCNDSDTSETSSREHIWTLAAGTATGVHANVHYQPGLIDRNPSTRLRAFDRCGPNVLDRPHASCYLGNCACHQGAHIRDQLLAGHSPQSLEMDFGVPSFVGDDYYCDGGSGADDLFNYANAWKSRLMFEDGNDVCAAGGKQQSEVNDLPAGWFSKQLSGQTSQPIEVRLMTGIDSYYENIGIVSIEMQACVCSFGVDADECLQRCEGTYREPLAAADSALLATVITVALVGGIGLFASLWRCQYIRAQRLLRQAGAVTRRQLQLAIDTTSVLSYPAAYVPAKDFLAMGQLLPYETLRDRGILKYRDDARDIGLGPNGEQYLVIFFSHQWVSFRFPDPAKVQYKVMCAAVQQTVDEIGWHRGLETVQIWADYCSIPQAPTQPHIRMSAISSLPLYSSASGVFVIIAPTVLHADTGAVCDIDTYSKRMWCRAEQLCYWLRNGDRAMYMASGEDGTVTRVGQNEGFLDSNLHVFQGTATKDEDKLSLVRPILGLYAELYSITHTGRAAQASHTQSTEQNDPTIRSATSRRLALGRDRIMQIIEERKDTIFPKEIGILREKWEVKEELGATLGDSLSLFGKDVRRCTAAAISSTSAAVEATREAMGTSVEKTSGTMRTLLPTSAPPADEVPKTTAASPAPEEPKFLDSIGRVFSDLFSPRGQVEEEAVKPAGIEAALAAVEAAAAKPTPPPVDTFPPPPPTMSESSKLPPKQPIMERVNVDAFGDLIKEMETFLDANPEIMEKMANYALNKERQAGVSRALDAQKAVHSAQKAGSMWVKRMRGSRTVSTVEVVAEEISRTVSTAALTPALAVATRMETPKRWH